MIAGPTAAGKTLFAIELAKIFKTIIFSCDSRQFYRELSIGTAKPTATELASVPHHFIGHLSIHDYYNVSMYEEDSISLFREESVIHPVILMAGGSGLYIDAVCKGVDFFPDPDPELRSYLKGILTDEGIGRIREMLLERDPSYYHAVDLSNPNRILRALEVCMTTGRPYSVQRLNSPKTRDFRILKIGIDLPRNELFDRINGRVDKMIAQGLLEEVKGLFTHRHLNALNTVGYKELFEYMEDKIPLEQAIENIKTNTRRYAKRQLTWFRKDKEIKWFHPEQISDVEDLITEEAGR